MPQTASLSGILTYKASSLHLKISKKKKKMGLEWGMREGRADTFFCPLINWYMSFLLEVVFKKYNLLSPRCGCVVKLPLLWGWLSWHQAKFTVGVETSSIIKYRSTLLSCCLINWCVLKTTLGSWCNLILELWCNGKWQLTYGGNAECPLTFVSGKRGQWRAPDSTIPVIVYPWFLARLAYIFELS